MPPDLRLDYLVFEVRHFMLQAARLSDIGIAQLKMAAGLIAQKVSGAPRQAKELA
jgi:hypothetical protein